MDRMETRGQFIAEKRFYLNKHLAALVDLFTKIYVAQTIRTVASGRD